MPTRREILDLGRPTVTFNEDGTPTTESVAAATLWGLAYMDAAGLVAAPTSWGEHLARYGRVRVGQAVAAHVHDTPTAGPVLNVQATVGGSTGPKAMIFEGAAAAGQVLVVQQADYTWRLTFAIADAITACAYLQVVTPASLRDFLEAEAE